MSVKKQPGAAYAQCDCDQVGGRATQKSFQEIQ
jgi:hypothetical protein